MNRISYSLCTAHGCLFAWLIWCAIQSATHGAPWACTVFVLGSLLVLTAALRETALDDALRYEAWRNARERHPAGRQSARAAAIDAAVATGLAAACCEQWWTHCGFCPIHHRSPA
ncbi:hypothetical protein [Streptomyces thermoviolaceus]|uniref:hypothetical protein n=1 Tax=Streptomyces thermoviolaceus TaxID=1952 RepID=UPI0016785775|nr:hypothetical protein [Streptomyces thermoviolaceus]GGV80428.1 hypothetical protein GCM10010499_43330 [Streptomyces thermoviolaceus subsp. apingens]